MNKSHAKRLLLESFDPIQHERPGVSSHQIMEIKEIFDMFDTDATGLAKVNDMIESLDSLGNEPKNQMLYFMLKQQQKNKTVHLDFYQFMDMITNRVSTKDNRRDMNRVFGLLDEDAKGNISLQTLKKVVKDMGDSIDETELQEMIERADLNGDGMVSEEEFYLFMTNKTPKAQI